MTERTRQGGRLCDRPEFHNKPDPLTFARDATVREAVSAMAARGYGSVVVVDADRRVEGVVTERDVLKRVVDAERDPAATTLAEVMTENPRTARADDDMVEWLRMMSNERFRRLPVVDEDGRLTTVLTQGDFVSYTWPDLIHQAGQLGKATVMRNLPVTLIISALLIYPLIVFGLFGLIGA